MRSHLLRVRLGMVTAMAIVIEFYVPEKFRKPSAKWIWLEQRGTIVRFPAPEKKSVGGSKSGWFGSLVGDNKE